ncbi:unnamed protein product, partial [Meganyctiphanes norvegica]
MQALEIGGNKLYWEGKRSHKVTPLALRGVFTLCHKVVSQKPKAALKKNRSSSSRGVACIFFANFQNLCLDLWNDRDIELCIKTDITIPFKHRLHSAIAMAHHPQHKSLHNITVQTAKITDLGVGNESLAFLNNFTQNSRLTHSVLSDKNFSQQRSVELARKVSREIPSSERDSQRLEKFQEVVNNNTSLAELRKLSWSGIPSPSRATTWRILNGYLPANNERREETLQRKREEYWSFVNQYYDTRHEDIYQDTYRQIHIDIPRMSPLVPLFQQIIVQELFERILYIWAIRHPASGYVQGINDLVTPFFMVFLREVVPLEFDVDTYDVSLLSDEDRNVVEADCFWCMSKLLDGIQDNYTFAQPGIQTKVQQLRDIVHRIDTVLHQHLEKHEIDYLQFSFRWFNNLLMRELPLPCTVRLWDTLHAEPDGFSHFVLYVCAAFLKYFSQKLMAQRDFQGLMLLLQNLPTRDWTDSEISMVVAEAFRLKYVFADAPNHLQGNKK